MKATADGVPRFDAEVLDTADRAAALEMFRALGEQRCFVIQGASQVCDGLGPLLSAAREVHSLPAEELYQAWRDRHGTWRGYQPSLTAAGSIAEEIETRPAFLEQAGGRNFCSFDVGPPWRAAGCRGGGEIFDAPQPWPSQGSLPSQITNAFISVHGFGVQIARSLLSAGGSVGEAISPTLEAPCSSLRLLRYEIGSTFSQAHTDYEMLALIAADHAGLQVLGADGLWREPAATEDDLTVIPGEPMEAATKNRVRAAVHRVRGGEYPRHAVALFVGVDYDNELQWPFTTGVTPYGHHIEGMLVRHTPNLWARYEAGELELAFDIPELNPFKGDLRRPPTTQTFRRDRDRP